MLSFQSVLSFPSPLICLIADHPESLCFGITFSKKPSQITSVGFGLTASPLCSHSSPCRALLDHSLYLLYLYVSCTRLESPSMTLCVCFEVLSTDPGRSICSMWVESPSKGMSEHLFANLKFLLFSPPSLSHRLSLMNCSNLIIFLKFLLPHQFGLIKEAS